MMIIDRIVEGIAVGETEDGKRVSLTDFPSGAREGDVLTLTGEGWQIDAAETERRREKAVARTRRIGGRRKKKPE